MDHVCKKLRILFYGQAIKQWFKTPTLLRDYFYFFSVTVLIALILSLYITWNTYRSYFDNINHQLEIEANHISHDISDVFNDTTQIINFLGKEIVKNNKENDLEYIFSLLKNGSSVKIDAIKFLSGISNFDWINPEGYQVINVKEGIIVKKPHNMHMRTYFEKCKKYPWKLHLSDPAWGIPSNLWIVPAGFGITNASGKFLGIIGVGFVIKELETRLKQQLKFSYTQFIVLDNKHDIAMSSHKNLHHSYEGLQNFLEKNAISFEKQKGVLNPSITLNNIVYCYYYKLKDYPYIVLVGWNKTIIDNEFYSLFFPRILEFLGFGAFCIILLYFFRRKIINPITELSKTAVFLSTGKTKVKVPRQSSIEMHNLAKSLLQVIRYVNRNKYIHEKLKQTYDLAKTSDEAKEEFLRRINNELKRPLSFILWYSDILIKHFKKEISIDLSLKKQIDILSKIQEAGQTLHTLTTNILNLSYVDVNCIIAYCLKIEAKSALLKNIKLNSHLQEKLPLFCADELRLKQIIVGLISLSIDYTYDGGNIHIYNALEVKSGKKFLKIVIEDDGFAFNKEDIRRLSDSINQKSVGRALDSTDLDLELIEKLVRMHEGKIEIESLGKEGKRTILTFPYKNRKSINNIYCEPQTDSSTNTKGNVYKLY